MNKFSAFFLVPLMVLSLSGKSQNSTLTEQLTFFSSGITQIYILLILTQNSVNQSAVGLNQNWDHSDLDLASEFIFSQLEGDDPNVLEFFPATNRIQNREVSGGSIEQKSYLEVDETGVYELGTSSNSSGTNQLITQTKRKLLYALPASFNDSWSEEFSSELSGEPSGFQETKTGTRTGLVEGEGILLLPSGKYEDVLRIRINESGTSQSYSDGQLIGPETPFETVIHEYWSAEFPFPLAIFSANNVFGQTFYEVFYAFTNPLAIGEKEVLWSVYPNPAKDQVVIDFPEGGVIINRIDMLDLTGKVIHSWYPSNTPPALLRLPEVSEGLYLFRTQTERGISTKKIALTGGK